MGDKAPIVLKIYRMTDMAIELVYKEVVDDNPKLPSSYEVASWPAMETILQKPLTEIIVQWLDNPIIDCFTYSWHYRLS